MWAATAAAQRGGGGGGHTAGAWDSAARIGSICLGPASLIFANGGRRRARRRPSVADGLHPAPLLRHALSSAAARTAGSGAAAGGQRRCASGRQRRPAAAATRPPVHLSAPHVCDPAGSTASPTDAPSILRGAFVRIRFDGAHLLDRVAGTLVTPDGRLALRLKVRTPICLGGPAAAQFKLELLQCC